MVSVQINWSVKTPFHDASIWKLLQAPVYGLLSHQQRLINQKKTEFPFKTTFEIGEMLPPFCIGFWWRQLFEQVQSWNFLAQLNDWILPKLFSAWYRLYFKYKLLHLASYYPSQHISRYNNLQYSIHFLRSTFYFLFFCFLLRSAHTVNIMTCTCLTIWCYFWKYFNCNM